MYIVEGDFKYNFLLATETFAIWDFDPFLQLCRSLQPKLTKFAPWTE